jgi:signal transduction histidine kinase
VRPGIRLQLLLALGALLVLAFVPLFFAVASLTRAAMTHASATSARALGRAVAAHVLAANAARAPEAVSALLDAQVGQDGVEAVGVYDDQGMLAHAAGASRALLPARIPVGTEQLREVSGPRGAGVLVIVPAQPRGDEPRGAVAVLMRADVSTGPAAQLERLVALYTGVVALALLVFAYFAMTRLVVQPVERLSRAAGRVADGAHRLEVPRVGARELADLAASIAAMTARLRADEDALRAKVDELERAGRELRAAQDQIVRSERLASVGRLAAGLAHEIGNPIAAILGFQELLIDGGLEDAEQRDFLERMKRETERVHRVLRDLLDFARPAVKSAQPDEAGDVAEAVRDVMALVKPQKSMRDVEMVLDLAPGLPPVRLAQERVVQVLLNLLLNAADAVPRATGRVIVRALRSAAGGVQLEVEDNGPGISPEIRDRLFEPFATTKEIGKGTGLGLAVCRGLIEGVDGSITAHKGGEGGARFVVELPAAPVRR